MRRSLPTLLALALLVATTGTLPARATAQATPPLDEITLVDGTFLRGTIVERSAERIVILLVTGEVRTYATSEVQSAGPRAEVASTPQPAAAPPPPPPVAVVAPAPSLPPRRLTRLHVWSDETDLSLQRLTGSATVAVSTGNGVGTAVLDQFAILCNVPCDLEIDPGTYQLGVARGTGGVIRTGAPIDLFGSVDLTVGYTNNEGLRIAGWITFIGGLVAATAMFSTALIIGGGSAYTSYGGIRREVVNVPLAIAAGVVGAIGIGVGMPFAFAGDGATVTRGRHAGRGSDGRGRAGAALREAEMEQLSERRSSPATPEALLPIREQDGAVEMDLSLAPGIAHARLAARPAEAARVQFGFAVTGPRPRFEGCTSARLRAGTRAAEIPVAVRTEALSGSVRETVVLDIALTDAETLAGTATIELCGRTVFVPPQHRPSVRAFLQRVVDLGASAPSMQ